WLVKTEPIHVAEWGTYITTASVTSDAADVSIKSFIDNDGPTTQDFTIKTTVYRTGATAVVASRNARSSAAPRSSQTVDSALKIRNPSLWSIESPNLYRAVVQLSVGGKVIDAYETTFGIRTIKFDAQQGFLLN